MLYDELIGSPSRKVVARWGNTGIVAVEGDSSIALILGCQLALLVEVVGSPMVRPELLTEAGIRILR